MRRANRSDRSLARLPFYMASRRLEDAEWLMSPATLATQLMWQAQSPQSLATSDGGGEEVLLRALDN